MVSVLDVILFYLRFFPLPENNTFNYIFDVDVTFNFFGFKCDKYKNYCINKKQLLLNLNSLLNKNQ